MNSRVRIKEKKMQITDNVTGQNIERGKHHDRAFKRFGEPMRTLLRALLICLVAPAAVALAQEPPRAAVASNPDNPISASNRFGYGFLKYMLLRSAEKMPEEYYNFKPTWVVRSFGRIIGHVADSQYSICSRVLGEKDPAPGIEKTKISKADLIAALKDSFTYCDKAYDGLTDASAAQIVKFQGLDVPKLFVLTANNMHSAEHYGNLVIYLRLKNILPPSSEPGFDPRPKK
jgi:uncharacterized damage-inducible protein DinB